MALLKRLGRLVLVFFVVTFFTFFLLANAPGDPAAAKAGLNATPETVEQMREESTRNSQEIRQAVEDGKQRMARLVEDGKALVNA